MDEISRKKDENATCTSKYLSDGKWYWIEAESGTFYVSPSTLKNKDENYPDVAWRDFIDLTFSGAIKELA